MQFADQPPSEAWSALNFRGTRIAEVWFKPDGDDLALVFRVPRGTFHIRGIGNQLSVEVLLKTVGVPADDAESWQTDGDQPGLADALAPPEAEADHRDIRVRLKSQAGPESAAANWHELHARWKTVLGLEAAVDRLRQSVDGLRAQVDASARQTLAVDDKLHALAADVAQWTKAKSRAHFALPKASEFVHRATWAAGTPERKRLGELFANLAETEPADPPSANAADQLEALRKDLQVLSATGTAVSQECKAIITDVQGALRRLQTNAAVRASKKRGGTGAKGKSL
jgi:uncharacterized protein YoxC